MAFMQLKITCSIKTMCTVLWRQWRASLIQNLTTGHVVEGHGLPGAIALMKWLNVNGDGPLVAIILISNQLWVQEHQSKHRQHQHVQELQYSKAMYEILKSLQVTTVGLSHSGTDLQTFCMFSMN